VGQQNPTTKASATLTMTEIREAMGVLGQQFDVVFFESCLMAGLEVAYQIKDKARFATFSEELMWARIPFRDWAQAILNNAMKGPKFMADLMATIYRDTFNLPKTDVALKKGYTVSVADLGKIQAVHNQVNLMALDLIVDMDDVKTWGKRSDNLQVIWATQILPSAHDFCTFLRFFWHTELVCQLCSLLFPSITLLLLSRCELR
jgi:hypothetical protein